MGSVRVAWHSLLEPPVGRPEARDVKVSPGRSPCPQVLACNRLRCSSSGCFMSCPVFSLSIKEVPL